MLNPLPVPADPYTALSRRIADLERLVREMSAARSLENSTIAQGGVKIVNGGSVQVVDTGGVVIATVGALPAQYNRADGSAQPGILFAREDGSHAAILGDLNPLAPPYKQSLQLIDRLGTVIVADDVNGGRGGLAVPHLAGSALQNTNVSTWPATTSATWTDIADAFFELQNPRLVWSATLFAAAGTTGQFRLVVDGTQVGTTQTVVGGGSGSFAFWNPPAAAIPATSNIGDIALVELDAQRTAGTGNVQAIVRFLSGTQS